MRQILLVVLVLSLAASVQAAPPATKVEALQAELVRIKARIAEIERQLSELQRTTTQPATRPAAMSIPSPKTGWEARARRASAPQEMVLRAQKHDEAIRKLLADGEITQEQADALLDGKPLVGMTRSHIALIGRVSLLDRNADASVMIYKLQVYSVTEIGHEYPQHPAAVYNLRVESGKISVIERKK